MMKKPQAPQTHCMMSFTDYFQATISKRKTHELRKDQPGITFRVGDTIILEEADFQSLEKTGRKAELVITYVSPSPQPWLLPGYTLMSIRLKRKWYNPTTWFNSNS
jgi:hypothetical protein